MAVALLTATLGAGERPVPERRADREGLRPTDYHVAALDALLAQGVLAEAMALPLPSDG